GLILEHRLQAALRDLGLVRGVRRQELRPQDDRVDERRNVVVVHPGSQERNLVFGRDIPRRQRAQLLVYLLLGQPLTHPERTAQPKPCGNLPEELFDRLDADLPEHLGAVGVGGGRVTVLLGVASYVKASMRWSVFDGAVSFKRTRQP